MNISNSVLTISFDYFKPMVLLILVCPTGWFFYEGACYKISGVKKTFEEAKTACLAETAAASKLFEPRSDAENQAIFDIMKNMFGDETEYFVGIEQDPNSDDSGT